MNEFAKLQYEKLREEIMSMEQRVGRAQMTAVSGIPVVLSLSQQDGFGLKYLALAVPMLCWIAVAFVAYLQGSLMRFGYYIREYIEPILAEGDLIPWEKYLELDGSRKPEKNLRASVTVTFMLYYLFSVIAAYLVIEEGIIPLWLGVICYISYGIAFFHGLQTCIFGFPASTGKKTKRIKRTDTKEL